jgi:hypothetical protein
VDTLHILLASLLALLPPHLLQTPLGQLSPYRQQQAAWQFFWFWPLCLYGPPTTPNNSVFEASETQAGQQQQQ